LNGTGGFALKWRKFNLSCCPGFSTRTLNNSWNLEVSPSKIRCFCCCSPKQELIFWDEVNPDEQIMRISYDPDIWSCRCIQSSGQGRVVQVYVLGQSEPIGKIEYDPTHKLDRSAVLWNLETNEVFQTETISDESITTGVIMQVRNALGVPLGIASVTAGYTYRGHTTYTNYQIQFPSGDLSPMTKCLMLALNTMWAVDHREKQFRSRILWSVVGILFGLIVFAIIYYWKS